VSNLHKHKAEFSTPKQPKLKQVQIHNRNEKEVEAFINKAKKERKMKSSHSTHKLEINKVKGLTSVNAFKKAPKITSKRDIYTKAARRKMVNLVSR
jgi:ribosome assembly protein YihI (activator of Der GTPase)